MKRTWIKLYVEILDDPKMGRLSNHLWRRAIELFLLAGRNGNDGLLPPVEEMAWVLRLSQDKVLEDLIGLAEVGVVHETPQGWMVTHFKDRQYSESYERTKRYLDRQKDRQIDGDIDEEIDEGLAGASSTSSSTSLSSSKVLEGGGVGEGKPIPETPKQAMEHPDIQVFREACGRIPGRRDYETVIETIQFLRKTHGENLVEYLKPFWIAWSSRKRKHDGKPYPPESIAWLCEWAVNNHIPRANGKEPVENPGQTMEELEAERARVREKFKKAKEAA
jgi:hypothetical protein